MRSPPCCVCAGRQTGRGRRRRLEGGCLRAVLAEARLDVGFCVVGSKRGSTCDILDTSNGLRTYSLRIRCFFTAQDAIIRPVTLLVGENSSGKTTFLALCQIASSLTRGFRSGFPFNELRSCGRTIKLPPIAEAVRAVPSGSP